MEIDQERLLSNTNALNYMDEELKKLVMKFEQLISEPCYNFQPQKQHQESNSAVKELEEEVETLKSAVVKEHEQVCTLKEELDTLSKESENRNTCDKLKSKELEKLKSRYESLVNWKLSSEDEEAINNLRLKYKILRNATGVQFNKRNCTENTITGVAFNFHNNQIKGFTIDKTGLSQDEVRGRIINHMDKVSKMDHYKIAKD